MITFRRFIAFMIDIFILEALFLYTLPWTLGPYPTFRGSFILISGLYGVLIIRDVLCGGRSIGKRIMKLYIVDEKNQKAAFWRLLLRNITLMIMAIDGIAILTMQRRLGDMLAKTNVEYRPKVKEQTAEVPIEEMNK